MRSNIGAYTFALRRARTKTSIPSERGERGGAAAAPAGRGLPQEARAARSLCKAKFGEDATRQTRVFFQTDCHCARYGGSGQVKCPPAARENKNFYNPRARRAGRRSRRARRARASAGSASRAEPGRGKKSIEPSVSLIRQKKNILAKYCGILYMHILLYCFTLACHRTPCEETSSPACGVRYKPRYSSRHSPLACIAYAASRPTKRQCQGS